MAVCATFGALCLEVVCYLLFQNFLYLTKEENSPLKAIDFGLSDYVKPGLDFIDEIHTKIYDDVDSDNRKSYR